MQRTCRNHGLVLACDQVWWWVTESFLRFCESSVQTDRQMKGQAKICLYNVHWNGDNDNWNIVDYIDVWLVWKSIGLHVLAFCQVGWICVHLLFHLTLTSHCDVISDVINIKSTFLGLISGGLSISDVKMNLSKIFRNFQNGRHFEARANF